MRYFVGGRMIARRVTLLPLVAGIVFTGACTRTRISRNNNVAAELTSNTPVVIALKSVFAKDFLIGAAVNPEQFEGRDAAGSALVKQQFNSISPENVLKWEAVHPKPGTYEFRPSDKYVAFGEKNNMFVIGHCLVWHSQVPRWVFTDAAGATVSRDTLLARMRDHISTVVGRYKGRIKGWDVVNEALNEDGTLRKSPWFTIIGEDYIARAFQFAHEADPAAQLYYNDYSLENPAKRAGAARLIKTLVAAGIPVHAIGSQSHMKMDWPSPALEDSMITILAATGVKVNVTELDIDVLPSNSANRTADVSLHIEERAALNPYARSLPDSVNVALARRYARMFDVYKQHSADIERITFWGVSDGDSWLNGWPIRGRTSYPLVFDRQHKPKLAFDSIVTSATRSKRGDHAKNDINSGAGFENGRGEIV